MKCPRCPDSALEEREREGVTVDACRSCYGIWLDRGELERLIARASKDYDEIELRASASRPPEPRYESRPPRTYDDDRDRPHHGRDDERYPHGRRKKRWFEALGDVFD